LVAAAVTLPLCVLHARSRAGWRAIAALIGCSALIAGAHLAWRWSYYGYPLPNTYYVKSSGDTALLRARGVGYVTLAATELGFGLVAAIAAGLLCAGLRRVEPAWPARRALAWVGRLLCPAYVLYVIAVGGDFLDLYRFFVPVLPLALVLAASAAADWLGRFARGSIGLVLVAALLIAHSRHQQALLLRARQLKEPARSEHSIEPLGWTREYALRWAALGRWIALQAHSDDWMAVGAAGAMPYYAGIRNLDTFGLCDAWVAHHAPIVGDRPGHQRFAPTWYILSKKPAFLLIGNDRSSDTPLPLRNDARWTGRGYVWVEARIDAVSFGAPRSFYHYLLMRRDRALERGASPWLRMDPAF
jgi:hypothetical protein